MLKGIDRVTHYRENVMSICCKELGFSNVTRVTSVSPPKSLCYNELGDLGDKVTPPAGM
jgi:hypothetical protein